MFYNSINFLFNLHNYNFELNSLLIRSLISFVFSFVFSIIGIKYLISYLKGHQVFQPIRLQGPEGHLITKQKTPTMGGLVVCLAVLCSGLLFCNLSDIYVVGVLIISMAFGLIGLIDDIMKVFYKNTNGFSGSLKLILETFICGLTLLWMLKNGSSFFDTQSVFIPFFKISIYIGILFIPFILIVIMGSTNGVNLTDGLDGLAIIPIMLSALILGTLALSTGYEPLGNLFVKTTKDNLSELVILLSSIIGSGIAFLIFNRHPAKIFMGDVGALMYGAFLGTSAVLLRQEIFYGLIGLLFVIESLSVIIQVVSYKLFKKRIFKMAPLHHHFEKIGWSEKRVVLSFWTFSLICLLIAILGIIKF